MPNVWSGLEVARRGGFDLLRGKRVGLIVNHTSLAEDGSHTLDLLLESGQCEVRGLFAPEHGVRGEVDDRVEDGVDSRTGIPVWSLYNPGAADRPYQPKPEHLEGLEAMVFDLQDIGVRFYTYSATLGYAMEAAAEAGIEFVVFDRPNPINGLDVDGNLPDVSLLGFTAYHTVPVRHGMTLGELALLYREERCPNLKLHVVRCEGWKRSMTWDQTGMMWTNPSPNMRSLTQAFLYPGVGLVEFTNLSVGRGTDAPFEHVGAPYLDAVGLCRRLNASGLGGIATYPERFTPASSRFAGESCSGVRFHIKDLPAFNPVALGAELMHVLNRSGCGWDPARASVLLHCSRTVTDMLEGGYRAAREGWVGPLQGFLARRSAHLQYPE